jgi:L-alanine-DL-glutamate epimerase-like enolase superfamily enzyme
VIRVSFRRLELVKLYPLAISRGSMATSENLFVTVDDGTHKGIGELSPATGSEWTAERGETQLQQFVEGGALADGYSIEGVWAAMKAAGIDPPAMAAMDIALWDLHGKQLGQPLYKVFGLEKKQPPTSVTIGINPPDVMKVRVPDILKRTGAKFLKVKLGSPEGVDIDCRNFEAAFNAAKPFKVGIRVDANGGWTIRNAKRMMRWLAEYGVDYIEQPLAVGQEDDLEMISHDRPMPIFVDESVRFAEDVPKFAEVVDGVNVKLMKCGGLTEARRIVEAARASGLKTMIGCMSESSIAIAAGASIGALFDHIDLDSHLNLNPDPATGAPIVKGVITPTDEPGHGASLVDA